MTRDLAFFATFLGLLLLAPEMPWIGGSPAVLLLPFWLLLSRTVKLP